MLRVPAAFMLSVGLLAPATALAAPQYQIQEELPGNRESHQEKDKATDDSQKSAAERELVSYLAAKMLLSNQAAIRIAEMATEQSDTPRVQELATTIVHDHKQLNAKLKKKFPAVAHVALDEGPWAGMNKERRGSRGREAGASEVGADFKDRDTRDGSSAAQRFDGPAKQLMKVTRLAINNSLHTTRQMMGKYQGQDFDMAFLGYQISGHSWLISELQAVHAAGPKPLRSLAEEASEMMARHLRAAEELSRSLEDDRQRRTARRND